MTRPPGYQRTPLSADEKARAISATSRKRHRTCQAGSQKLP